MLFHGRKPSLNLPFLVYIGKSGSCLLTFLVLLIIRQLFKLIKARKFALQVINRNSPAPNTDPKYSSIYPKLTLNIIHKEIFIISLWTLRHRLLSCNCLILLVTRSRFFGLFTASLSFQYITLMLTTFAMFFEVVCVLEPLVAWYTYQMTPWLHG